MKRKFVTNLALVLFLNLLVKPFWIFGIDRTVQNVVGAEGYGFYFSLFSYSLLLNILLDLGITTFNNRSIAREPEKLQRYFSKIVGLKFLLALFYAAICLLSGWLLGYDKAQLNMLWVLILNQFLASFILYLRSNISGLHYFRTDSMISVLDRTLVIIICGVLLWGNVTQQAFKIEWFVYSQTVAYVLTALVTFGIVWYRAGYFRLQMDLPEFTKIIRQSFPFALLILLMTFYNRIDSVMLERILESGKVQAGIYAQSFRILDAASMFAFLFAGLLLPIFSRMLKKSEDVGEMVRLSFTLIIVPAATLAGLGLYYGYEILDWMYNEHIEASSRIFPLLMIGFMAISATYIFGTLLTANGNLRELNILASSAVVLNIVLNLLLIPEYQALGAAISSMVTQVYMALLQVIISIIKLKLIPDYGFATRLAVYFLVLLLLGYLAGRFMASWYKGAILIILSSIMLMFATKLVKFKELYRIIRFDESGEGS
jgi:O-antigen/teichoic acid export membrane protein